MLPLNSSDDQWKRPSCSRRREEYQTFVKVGVCISRSGDYLGPVEVLILEELVGDLPHGNCSSLQPTMPLHLRDFVAFNFAKACEKIIGKLRGLKLPHLLKSPLALLERGCESV